MKKKASFIEAAVAICQHFRLLFLAAAHSKLSAFWETLKSIRLVEKAVRTIYHGKRHSDNERTVA